MKKIFENFKKKDEITSFEEKLLWREEMIYLLERKRISDILLKEIFCTLNFSIVKKEIDYPNSSIIDNFNLFFKYLKKPKKLLKKRMLHLINQSEEYLNDKHKFSTLHNDFFVLLNFLLEPTNFII